MCKQILIFFLTAATIPFSGLYAQLVNYSPYLRDYTFPQFQVAGKAGNYYWVQKENIASSARENNQRSKQMFQVFDSKMNAVNVFPADALPAGTVKEYFVAGPDEFSQMMLVGSSNQTEVMVKRFSPDGNSHLPLTRIASIPFRENGSGFLLLRSPSKNRIALLAFGPDATLHIILFDADWKIRYQKKITDPNISQPCIQEDFVSFPIEVFDNLPVKLEDNGEWLMSTASRTSGGYLFFHFCDDGQFSFRHIRLPAGWITEDLSLTLDHDEQKASVGILSGYRSTTLKQLHVTKYSMEKGSFEFDSSYFFNTLAGNLRNRNIVSENLVGLHGGAYLFLKEYGREKSAVAALDDGGMGELPASALSAGPINLPVNLKNGFARREGLQALQTQYDRGDLSMFYFPGGIGDSTWSGMLRSPQTSEMNWPALSYLIMPAAAKMMFIYNAPGGDSQYATTTVLDRAGNLADGSLSFWKFNRRLNFQHARRILDNEVAVPYADRPGFAVIHMPGE